MAGEPTYTKSIIPIENGEKIRITIGYIADSVDLPRLRTDLIKFDGEALIDTTPVEHLPTVLTSSAATFEVPVTVDGAYGMEFYTEGGEENLDEWIQLLLFNGLHCLQQLAEVDAGKTSCKTCGPDDYIRVKALISAIVGYYHQLDESLERGEYLPIYKGINNLTDLCIKCGFCACGC